MPCLLKKKKKATQSKNRCTNAANTRHAFAFSTHDYEVMHSRKAPLYLGCTLEISVRYALDISVRYTLEIPVRYPLGIPSRRQKSVRGPHRPDERRGQEVRAVWTLRKSAAAMPPGSSEVLPASSFGPPCVRPRRSRKHP